MMPQFTRLLFLLAWLSLGLQAEAQIRLTGQLTFSEERLPLPAHPVLLITNAGDSTWTETDDLGFYAIGWDMMVRRVLLITPDPCTGERTRADIAIPQQEEEYTLNVHLCRNINPPPPPTDGCYAAFRFEPLPGGNVQFWQRIHVPEGAEYRLVWDFGDGQSSTEPNPLHTYTARGTYVVTLTLTTADGCTSAVRQRVRIFRFEECPCPPGGYPVCVQDTASGEVLFFPNLCTARCAGYTTADTVACDNGECICPEYYFPVCVVTPTGDTLTFDNPCYAQCAGYDDDAYFVCNDQTGCECELGPEPVCVNTPYGEVRLPNACVARRLGISPERYTYCDGNPNCWCPEDVYDPVCVLLPNGEKKEFVNPCEARCAGYTPDQWVACDTACPEYYLPVCILTDGGDTLTFSNPCFAAAAGYTNTGSWLNCEQPEDCVCPAVYDPVCVRSGAGLLTFENACRAACFGFGAERLVDCSPDHCGENIPNQLPWVRQRLACSDNPCGAIMMLAVYGDQRVIVISDDPNTCSDAQGVVYSLAGDTLFVYGGIGGLNWEKYQQLRRKVVVFSCAAVQCAGWQICDPVCVFTEESDVPLRIANKCLAEALGYTSDQWKECGPVVAPCPTVIDPVCVATPSGGFLRFRNACEAERNGYSGDLLVDCPPRGGDCDCTDNDGRPVCVTTACGTIRLPNRCVARCLGIDDSLLQLCGPDVGRCAAAFSIDHVDSLSVLFMDESRATEPIVEWFWEFGDGTTSNEPSPVHTYTKPGLYVVTLYVATANCKDRLTRRVRVDGMDDGGIEDPACRALFFFRQPTDDLLSFQFINQSRPRANVASYRWDFGDGQTSTEFAPSHTYAAPGFYLVSLTVAHDSCRSRMVLGIQVGGNVWYDSTCQALFLPVFQTGSTGVLFKNVSSPPGVKFAWDFGDGYTSEMHDAYHLYDSAGVYTVTLTITTVDGCTSTYAAEINLHTNDFTGSPTYALLSSTDGTTLVDDRVHLYPNPATGRSYLVLPSGYRGTYQATLTTITGQLIRRQIGVQDGQAPLPLDLSGLSAGLYFVQVKTDGLQQTLRLLVQ